jgi:hypothetical protein
MCNHTAGAKDIVIAARTFAIALLTIGMCVGSSSAESDQLPHLNPTAVPYEVDFQPVLPSSRTPISTIFRTSHTGPKLSEICSPTHTVCPQGDNDHCCDQAMACRYSYTANGNLIYNSTTYPTCEPPLTPRNTCVDDNECVSGVCAAQNFSGSPTGKLGTCQ